MFKYSHFSLQLLVHTWSQRDGICHSKLSLHEFIFDTSLSDSLVMKKKYPFFFILLIFHTSVSWWLSTGVWVTASLFQFPGLFLIFWLILKMLSFGWSPLALLFLSPPVPLSILWWLYRAHQLLLVSPSLSCSIVFSFLK